MTVLLTALGLLAACAAVGHALLALGGLDRRAWYGPAIGLGTLVVLAQAAIKLPGEETTALVLCAVAVAAGLVTVGLRRPGRPAPSVALVVLLAGAAASLPFIASGRIGLLGMGLNNDLALHLLWAEGLRDEAVAVWAAVIPGYPLAPHSLAVVMAEAGGVRMDVAFAALMLAVVPMTALAAGAFAERAAGWRRILVALTGGLAYLASAYYGQGAFKETMLALALIAFVAYARDLLRRPLGDTVAILRAALPGALLVAGAVYTFSHAAVAWLGGFTVAYGIAMLALRPWLIRRALRRDVLLRGAAVLGGLAVVLLVVFWPQLEDIRTFGDSVGTDPAGNEAIPVTNLGNLPGPLSVYEGLGLWPQADFRFPPAHLFHAGQWAMVAVAAIGLGGLLLVAARDLALPVAVAVCAAIYWYSDGSQSPYVTAKALAIGAPLVATTAAAGLLGFRRGSELRGAGLLRLGLGLLFVAVALLSASKALRFSPVAHDSAGLRELAQRAGSAPTLFLGHDDFSSSETLGTPIASPTPQGHPALPVALSSKPWQYGSPLDWDNISVDELDRFDFAIVPDGRYRSAAPTNFRSVATAGGYELFERSGPTPPREAFDAAGSPGEVLDCRTRAGRRLVARGGRATVTDAPVVVANPGAIAAGSYLTVALALPPGRWDLSLQYVSPQDLDVTAPGLTKELPAYLGRPGPYFALGTVTSSGRRQPTTVSLYAAHPSRLTSPSAVASISAIAATRSGDARTVPVADACGRYVDSVALAAR